MPLERVNIGEKLYTVTGQASPNSSVHLLYILEVPSLSLSSSCDDMGFVRGCIFVAAIHRVLTRRIILFRQGVGYITGVNVSASL